MAVLRLWTRLSCCAKKGPWLPSDWTRPCGGSMYSPTPGHQLTLQPTPLYCSPTIASWVWICPMGDSELTASLKKRTCVPMDPMFLSFSHRLLIQAHNGSHHVYELEDCLFLAFLCDYIYYDEVEYKTPYKVKMSKFKMSKFKMSKFKMSKFLYSICVK